MFKLHFFNKVIKKNVSNHIIDFKSFVLQKHVPFCESTHSLSKKQNHTKISNFSNFERKGCKAKVSPKRKGRYFLCL